MYASFRLNARRQRLLVADDDDVVAVGIGALMQRRGLEVETVRTLDEATPAGPYDVVVLDPEIASRDRVEMFVRALRRINPDVQILLFSEFLDEWEVSNDVPVITKPAPVERYTSEIEASLKLRKKRR